MPSIIRRKYKDAATGRVKRCKHYVVEYREGGKLKRFTPLSATGEKVTHRDVAEALFTDWQRERAREGAGLLNPHRKQLSRSFDEHRGEYIADLEAAGRDPKYTDNMDRRLRILARACGWQTLTDVEPNAFMRWRDEQRRTIAKRRGRVGETTAAATLNQYLDTARAFLNWCVASKRIGANALAHVDKVTGEKKRKRRGLTDDEVTRLLANAPAGRKLVYRVALAIGLRRSELEQLQWGDLRLNAITPYVQLRAEATKARRADRLSLPASLAEALRTEHPADAPDAQPVFAAVPTIYDWRDDLKAAGIAYTDAMGRQADFHGGTRKTLCTRLHRAGVPLAVAMRAMRHTDARLTMVDYVDDEQLASDHVTAALPELLVVTPAPTPDAAALGA